jgi:hypothetical protein
MFNDSCLEEDSRSTYLSAQGFLKEGKMRKKTKLGNLMRIVSVFGVLLAFYFNAYAARKIDYKNIPDVIKDSSNAVGKIAVTNLKIVDEIRPQKIYSARDEAGNKVVLNLVGKISVSPEFAKVKKLKIGEVYAIFLKINEISPDKVVQGNVQAIAFPHEVPASIARKPEKVAEERAQTEKEVAQKPSKPQSQTAAQVPVTKTQQPKPVEKVAKTPSKQTSTPPETKQQTELEAKQDPSWSPQKAAEQLLWKKVTKCGDSHYTKDFGPGDGLLGLYEFKGLSIKITASPLTEADKLNGIEWKGTVILVAKASRAFKVPGVAEGQLFAREKVWLNWENGAKIDHQTVSGSLAKRKGRWHLQLQTGVMGLNLKPVKCSEIPSGG